MSFSPGGVVVVVVVVCMVGCRLARRASPEGGGRAVRAGTAGIPWERRAEVVGGDYPGVMCADNPPPLNTSLHSPVEWCIMMVE